MTPHYNSICSQTTSKLNLHRLSALLKTTKSKTIILGYKGNVYTVPSDWNIFVVYNSGYVNGGISFKSWASKYTEKDIGKI